MRLCWKIKDWWFDIRMWWQRKTRGYSDIEVWNLDDSICKWVLPRLKAFRESTIGYPNVPGKCDTFEDWQAMVDEMIFGFDWAMKEDDWYHENVFYKTGKEKEEALEVFNNTRDRAQKGRELFGKWMMHLWW